MLDWFYDYDVEEGKSTTRCSLCGERILEGDYYYQYADEYADETYCSSNCLLEGLRHLGIIREVIHDGTPDRCRMCGNRIKSGEFKFVFQGMSFCFSEWCVVDYLVQADWVTGGCLR
ncbi:MAG: hypothetical protein KM312_05425 [Hydrogenibacillus schlegelii]|uniref:Uncharacterized protein n=1 Tax=Hydrogenibacillus schlegelii TaxID=1484 RepID=A0A947GH59_HYDSH|nr:hypothetical protein [Hydrogenibacillus schlegelii]